jgi:hypothetical protein
VIVSLESAGKIQSERLPLGSAPIFTKCHCDGGRNHPATVAGEIIRAEPRRKYQNAVPMGRQTCLLGSPQYETYQRRRHDRSLFEISLKYMSSVLDEGVWHTFVKPFMVSTNGISLALLSTIYTADTNSRPKSM